MIADWKTLLYTATFSTTKRVNRYYILVDVKIQSRFRQISVLYIIGIVRKKREKPGGFSLDDFLCSDEIGKFALAAIQADIAVGCVVVYFETVVRPFAAWDARNEVDVVLDAVLDVVDL